MKTKLLLLFVFAQGLLFAQTPQNAKYVFLFIGDGMGLAQTSLTEYYKQATGEPNYRLRMNTLPVQGIITTHSQSHTITCSAAAGTALACGYKTSKGTIGMDANHQIKYKSIATLAHEQGKKTGIITSVSIDHATPSVFYAHSGSRDDYYDISLQLASSQFDFFAGGSFLDPQGNKSELPKPRINAYKAAQDAGYSIIKTKEQFKSLQPSAAKILAIDSNLWHNIDLPYTIDRRPDALSLADLTKKGIDLLTNPSGFFMMVEGGKIDWACHNNDAITAINEVLDFDRAIEQALKFAETHPNETLIIVTSDHETGGLALGFTDTKYDSYLARLATQKHSYQYLTTATQKLQKQQVPYQQLFDSLQTWYGFAQKFTITELEHSTLKKAYQDFWNSGVSLSSGAYKDSDPVTLASLTILAHNAGINWSSLAHSAAPVPIRAMGVGQELFSGYQDNTSVAKHVFELWQKK